jgi:hypothetical protein
MAPTWQSISEGDVLPELTKRPGVTQLVKYSAGSGDFNPLHHDFQFPQSKQLGSIIVHGRFKYRGMDFPDREFVCRGAVTKKWEANGEKLVALAIWTESDDGKKTTPGEAIVALRG